MAFADSGANAASVSGMGPPFPVTAGGDWNKGDLIGVSGGAYVRADSDGAIFAEFVAGKAAASGDIGVPLYRAARVWGGSRFTGGTVGASLFLSDTAGRCDESEGSTAQHVGFVGQDGLSVFLAPVYLNGGMEMPASVVVGDDDLLAVGTGSTARFSWDTTDADANAMLLQLPAGGGTDVPVVIIGQSIESVDPGLYDGVVNPRVAMFGVGAVTTAPILEFRKARGTFGSPTVVTSGDDLGTLDFYGAVAAGEYVRAASIRADMAGTIATTRGPGTLTFLTATDAAPSVLTAAMTLNADQTVTFGADVLITGDDGGALGASGTAWSDLFLASGGVIDWDSGDVTLTHAANTLTLGSGDLLVANGFGVVVGHTGQETISDGDGATDLVPEVQILGTGQADGSLMLAVFSTTATRAGAPTIALVKGGDAAIGTHTTVTDDEVVGSIIGYADDGADLETPIAAIQFVVDGTPAASQVGGSIEFYTTLDGTSTLALGMTLTNGGSVFLNQQGQDVAHLSLRSSDVTTGMSTINLGPDVTTNDYLSIGKVAAATGGAYITAVDASAAVGLHVESWSGAPATTDTTTSLAAMNFFVGQHDGNNADADMAGNSNAVAWGEIGADGARVTRMLLKADDGEVHVGNTTLADLAADDENDILALRAVRRETAAGGFVDSRWEAHNPYRDYEKLRTLNLVGERDKEGFFLFPLQKRLAFHEDAMFQMYTDIMDLAAALPAETRAQLSARLQNRLALLPG